MSLKILAICISCDSAEMNDFNKYTSHIIDKLPNITWYHIFVDKDMTIPDAFDEDGYSLLNRLKTITTNSIFLETNRPYNYLDNLLKYNNDIDAIVYYGHGGGEYLSLEKNPLLPTIKFAELLHNNICTELKFIYFDCCHLGCLPWMGYFANITKYIVASPNYYDWVSILELEKFHKMHEGNLEELIDVIENFVQHFNDTDSLVEIGIYDPKYAHLLWNCFVYHEQSLNIDKYCNIDGEIFDLCKMVHNSKLSDDCLQYFEELFNKTIVHRRRCSKCAKSVPKSYIGITLLEYKKKKK